METEIREMEIGPKMIYLLLLGKQNKELLYFLKHVLYLFSLQKKH